jgi:pimeloyl-ACP methyl ester carboxylesterase
MKTLGVSDFRCDQNRRENRLTITYRKISYVIPSLMLSITLISASSFLNFAAYGKGQNSSFQADAAAIDNMPAKKVKVGDIDMAYKRLGNSSDTPIVLIIGCCTTMDMWNPSVLKELSLNRSVIIFDNRGAGETTLGTREFSISQFVDDTVGLLDQLKIPKADIFGISMGSIIAKELALMNPDRVESLILTASTCGGPDAMPPNSEVIQALEAMSNNTSSSPTQEELKRITSTLFPQDWFEANPNYPEYIPFPKESVSPQIIQKQTDAIVNWSATGTCDNLTRIAQPTLVMIGTDDIWSPAPNSLMMAEKIPAAWLVQIRDAGHGLMYQYPDIIGRIVTTFLQTAG